MFLWSACLWPLLVPIDCDICKFINISRDELKEFEKAIQEDLQGVDDRLEEEAVMFTFAAYKSILDSHSSYESCFW